jgi:hypothetical protein
MFRTYDDWKTTDPRDRERAFVRCPLCKSRHWEDEDCGEAECWEPDYEPDNID